MSLRNLDLKERTLLALYLNCKFQMAPEEFYAKWDVTHAMMAQICGCSESTVDRWFQKGKGYQPPEPIYLRRLAEINFLWENYQEIPPGLRKQLCRERQPPQ